MNHNISIAGEFRFEIMKNDEVLRQTEYSDNIILNQGLDFFGDDNGSDMFMYCVIGAGNTIPDYTQTKLTSYIAATTGTTNETYANYSAPRDGNMFKTYRECVYEFSNLGDVNIAELGLASAHSSSTNYNLCTRALITDSLGNASVISLREDEVLRIFYRVWQVFTTDEVVSQVNVQDGDGNTVIYNCTTRLANVNQSSTYGSNVGKIATSTSDTAWGYSGSIAAITSSPSGNRISFKVTRYAYTSGTYKKRMMLRANLADTLTIKTLLYLGTSSSAGAWQIGYSAVSNGVGLVKTNQDILEMPVEFSWGRYEGEL